jgi:cytochrome c peroxidase
MRKATLFRDAVLISLAVLLPLTWFWMAGPAKAQEKVVSEKFPPIGPLPSGPHPGPPDNPTTAAKAELGKMMFFEPRLSGDTSTPCSKCHDPGMGWGTSDDVSVGYPGTQHFRNSHTVLNSAYLKKLFWDGRVTSLEAQFWAAAGGESAGNMSPEMGEARLRQVPEYRKRFMDVFGELPTADNIARAGAAFQRTLVSDPTKVPFDRYMNGDKKAMTPEAIKGMELFQGKAGCVQCHNGIMFTDEDFHSLGLSRNPAFEEDPLRQIEMRYRAKIWGTMNYMEVDQDLGLYFQTHRKEDLFKWRTQPLRELKYTSPYFHNGMAFTLEEVVEFYNQGGGEDPYGTKSPLIKPLNLTEDEKKALVAFLESLSSPEPPFADIRPVLPNYEPPLKEEAKK